MSRLSVIVSKARSVIRSTRAAQRIIFLFALLTVVVVISMSGEGISETLATLQSVWLALAAIGGVVVAAEGLETWHKQIRGRNDYDLALKLQTNVFRLRDLLTTAHALSLEEDYSNAEETSDPDCKPTTYPTLTPRWQQKEYTQEIYSAIDDVRKVGGEAQVLWGKEIDRTLVPFLNYALELTNYIGYLEAKDKPLPTGFSEAHLEEWYGNKRDPIKQSQDSSENDFQVDVRQAAEEIRSYLAKYLDR